MENDVNIIISALATLINIVKWFVFLLGVLFMFAVVLVAGGAGDTKTMPKSRVGNFFILGIFQAIVTGLTYLYTGWVNQSSLNAIHMLMREHHVLVIAAVVTGIIAALFIPKGQE